MARLMHVTITITNGIVEAFPPCVYIKKREAQQVCWFSPQGEATINFNATPFASDRFVVPEKGSVATGIPTGHDGTYKYSIIMRIKGDRREYVLDPEVIVEP